MSTSILKALPGKLYIKRHSPCILYISASLAMSTSILKALHGKIDIKRRSPSILYISASLTNKAFPGKLDIKRHSPSILYLCNNSDQTSFSDTLTSARPLGVQQMISNSYTMGCPPVRRYSTRALASGLSYVQVDNNGIIILNYLHLCRPCTPFGVKQTLPW